MHCGDPTHLFNSPVGVLNRSLCIWLGNQGRKNVGVRNPHTKDTPGIEPFHKLRCSGKLCLR